VPLRAYPLLVSRQPMGYWLDNNMNRFWHHYFCLIVISILTIASGGCKSMTPGDLETIQAQSDRPCAGNVYLLRGFIGIWSYGIDHLGEKINNAGVRASVFQEDQWQRVCNQIAEKYQNNPKREPLVLIGHSYGADDVIRIAKQLGEHNITVDLLVTLDPVTPPQVPANIKLCYNIYQPGLLDALPFFRGVPLDTESPEQHNLRNVNIRGERQDLLEPNTDHFNIEKNEKIHVEVVAKVKEFCPLRSEWASHLADPAKLTQAPAPQGVLQASQSRVP
jgi:hypothetical protein